MSLAEHHIRLNTTDSAACERAVVAYNHFGHIKKHDMRAVSECVALVESYGAIVCTVLESRTRVPSSRFLFGSGMVTRITDAVQAHTADIVIINHALRPVQQRNIEQTVGVRVCDRVGLILAIFAKRAESHAGKLQVELAQLTHLATRLVRGWTHLERQRGGIGLRGPGEKQLELDRRMIGIRIRAIKKQLAKVANQSALAQKRRTKNGVVTAVLVGYTNAGKSTLLNALCRASVYAADRLFATLDTTTRRLFLSSGREVVLCDTVGFLHDLPHELIDAFFATLSAVRHADVLVHVIDAGDRHAPEYIDSVYAVLAQLGVRDTPMITVMNKIDATENTLPRHDDTAAGRRVWLSAEQKEGLDFVCTAIEAVCEEISE